MAKTNTDRIEDDRGVHLMIVEHTLCGDAFDIGEDSTDGEMRDTKRRTISCPDCVRILLECKAARMDPKVVKAVRRGE